MLCSRFLRAAGEQRRSWFYRVTERYFDGMLRFYDSTLQWALHYRSVTLGTFAVLLAATIYMFIIIPKGFIPEQDTDQLVAITEAAQGTSYDQMLEYQKAIAEVIRRDASVESLVSSVGGAASTTLGGPNFGEIIVHLKPRSQRRLLVNGVRTRL